MTSAKRNFGLDLVRALAISLVLVNHFAWLWAKPGNAVESVGNVCGLYGVEIFFVLSGFLIGGILLRLQGEKGLSQREILQFWIRRWFRTLPNYVLFLALYTLVTLSWIGPVPEWWRYTLFLQNFSANHVDSFFGISWSLSIEEWMYLLFPLILAAGWVMFKRRARTVLGAIAFVLIACICARALFGSGTWDADVRKIVLFRLDAIGLGVLLAYLKTDREAIWRRLTSPFVATIGVGGVAVLAVCFIRAGGSTIPTSFLMNVGFTTAMDVAFALVIPFMSTLRRAERHLEWSIVRISLYSYSLYLCHPLVMLGVDAIAKATHVHSALIRVMGYLALSFAVAALVYHFYEFPLTNLRERFGRNKSRQSLPDGLSASSQASVPAGDVAP